MPKGVVVTSLSAKVRLLLESRFKSSKQRFGTEIRAHARVYEEMERQGSGEFDEAEYDEVLEKKKTNLNSNEAYTFINNWLDGTTKTVTLKNLHALSKISDLENAHFQRLSIEQFAEKLSINMSEYIDPEVDGKSPASDIFSFLPIMNDSKNNSEEIVRRYGGFYWEYRHSFTVPGWFMRSLIRIGMASDGHATFDRVAPYTTGGFVSQQGIVIKVRENIYLLGEDNTWSEIFLMILQSDPEEKGFVDDALIGIIAHVADREQFPVATNVYLRRDKDIHHDELEAAAEEGSKPYRLADLEGKFGIDPKKIDNEIPRQLPDKPYSLTNNYVRNTHRWPVDKMEKWKP